jgi:hypothetical protein
MLSSFFLSLFSHFFMFSFLFARSFSALCFILSFLHVLILILFFLSFFYVYFSPCHSFLFLVFFTLFSVCSFGLGCSDYHSLGVSHSRFLISSVSSYFLSFICHYSLIYLFPRFNILVLLFLFSLFIIDPSFFSQIFVIPSAH